MDFRFARDALKYIIKKYHIREIYIPYYLCDVMRHSVFEVGCKPIFYHIDDNFFPIQTFPKNSFILYPNYFGICDKNIDKLVQTYDRLIVDNAHAYYAKPRGFASFNSAKKFLPAESGAQIFFGAGEQMLPPKNCKRLEYFKEYDKIFTDNELTFDVEADCVPFCYPYLAPTIEIADTTAKNLMDRGLTIYRYWNNLPKSFNEYKFYSRLVPIPLDTYVY